MHSGQSTDGKSPLQSACSGLREGSSAEPGLCALIGPPNSGKSSLFNWLTGSDSTCVNYPGSTVELYRGKLRPVFQNSGAKPQLFLDTPGVYSLFSKNADESLTRGVLSKGGVSHIVLVLSPHNLGRGLFLLEELLAKVPMPIVVAVNMWDRAKGRLDIEALKKRYKVPFVPTNGLLGEGLVELLKKLHQARALEASSTHKDWSTTEKQARQKNIEHFVKQLLSEDKTSSLGDADRILLHPVWGFGVFLFIMCALFWCVFWFAIPFMDFIDYHLAWLMDWSYAALQKGLFASFVSHGVLAGFSAVVIFAPQIFILYVCLGLLESSGYLARAATLIDRPFSKIGLSGRSFVPLLSGFACAVPAVLATRTISSPKEKLLAILVIPFMACSARLPVYALLVSFLFAERPLWQASLCFVGLYVGGMVLGAASSGVLNKLLKKHKSSIFVMDLPPYKWPSIKTSLRQSFMRTKLYFTKAGWIIFSLSVGLWVLTSFPRLPGEQPGTSLAQLEHSYAGKIGRLAEPVFEPMGMDGRVGLSLICAFAAREVFVSSLAVVLGAAVEDSDQKGLLARMHSVKNRHGEKIFTLSSVVGLMVFFMIALQCLSTTGVTISETGSWWLGVSQFVFFNALAYLSAVGVVQFLNG